MAESGGFTRSGTTWRSLEQRASIVAEEITRLQDSEDSDKSDNDDFVSDSDDDSAPQNLLSNLERFAWNFVTPESDNCEKKSQNFLVFQEYPQLLRKKSIHSPKMMMKCAPISSIYFCHRKFSAKSLNGQMSARIYTIKVCHHLQFGGT